MTRAFVAIQPPAEVLDAIAARVTSMAIPRARVTTRDQWHLTVQFLGDDADISQVVAAFERGPLDLGEGVIQLGGAEAIGGRRRARVLALGLCAGAEWMQELAGQVARRLAHLGPALDVRDHAFLPHLTLARFREPTDVRALCAAIGPEPVGLPWRVEELVVFESRLAPRGAEHTSRAQVRVGR